MKTQDKRMEFIRLRAEGKSYRQIEAETGISKSTCSEWEHAHKSEIDRLRQDNLQQLYQAYAMTREARIRNIGDTLHRIDEALAAADLTKLSPERLLEFKLKYTAALKEEHTAIAAAEATGKADDTLAAIQSLYRRTVSGETSIEQAKSELAILDHMVDGYRRAQPLDAMFSM